MKIEVKNNKLLIDGKFDSDSYFDDEIFYIENKETLEILSTLKVEALEKYFKTIVFNVYQEIEEWDEVYAFVYLSDDNDNLEYYKQFSRHLYISVYRDGWAKNYSINTLRDVIEEYCNEHKYIWVPNEDLGVTMNIGYIVFSPTKKNVKFESIISGIKKVVFDIKQMLLGRSENLIDREILTALFEFPPELRNACKQYLIYFSQFLADLGIQANTSIKDEANKVLFSVIPENGNVALEKIKEALDIYINVPGMADIDIKPVNYQNDIAVLQWESNIHHLRGQVALAQATLQAKDATIEALQLSNYRLKEHLSLKETEEKPITKQEEKIIGGVVTVRKYDSKFLSIDLPAIIRKLKRKK